MSGVMSLLQGGEHLKDTNKYFHILGISKVKDFLMLNQLQKSLNEIDSDIIVTTDSSSPDRAVVFGSYYYGYDFKKAVFRSLNVPKYDDSFKDQVFKHLPDRDYEQTADQWLVTTGAIDANSLRPAQILPETNRQYLNRQEMGPAAPNGYTAEEKRPMFKKTDKQQLASDTVRNAYGTEIFIDSDHQQSSYKMYPNEREVTEERTYEGNVKSLVPGETIELQDTIKTTLKETTISPANPNGFTQTVTTFPEERLQDKPKTGKKETVLFEHTGNARGSTLQEMAQDQYFRADLNPNKEVIAQGRAPTFESTKLTNGMDTINMDIKKIEDDYFNHRINGVTHVFQEIPTDNTCKYTRDKDTLNNDTIAHRIEGDLLDPFKHNPYTHSLHSFAY